MKWKLIVGFALLGACGVAVAGPVIPLMMMAGAASAAGGAALVFSTFATGAMFVGGAVGMIGYAAGNKDLIRAGSIIGAVGGAAGLLQGMAGAGAAAGEAGGTAAGETAIEPLMGTTEGAGLDYSLASAGGGTGGGAAATTTAMPEAGAIAGEAGGNIAAGSGAGGITGPGMTAPQIGAPTGAGMTASQAGGAGMTAPQAGGMASGSGWSAGMSSDGGAAAVGTNAPQAAANPEGQGIIDQGLGWMRKNPAATQLGSGILQGAMGAYGQQEARQDQMDYYNRLREQYNQSIMGMNRVPQFIKPGAVVTRGPVQNPNGYWTPGTPAPVVPPTRG